VLCFISCAFLFASSIICISTLWKALSSSSSRPSKERPKKMKQELLSWSKISDLPFTNGWQEDFSKNISLFSCQWSLSDLWIRKSLMSTTSQKKWSSLSKVSLDLELRILLIGCQIAHGIWFKRCLSLRTLNHLLKIYKKMLLLDSKIGITNCNLKMPNFLWSGRSLTQLLSRNCWCFVACDLTESQ